MKATMPLLKASGRLRGQHLLDAEGDQQPDIQRTPMKRAGRPEEIAPAFLYLASDEASFATGAEIVVDGGMTSY